MKTEEFVNKIWEKAELILFPIGGYNPEISIKALIENEHRINQIYPFGHKPLLTTILPFAVQLGKVLIKEIPGTKWIDKEIEHPYDLELETYSKNNENDNVSVKIFPMNRIEKFWITSREFSLSNMVITLKFMSEHNINDPELTKKADKDGWINIGYGNLIRLKTIDKKDLPN